VLGLRIPFEKYVKFDQSGSYPSGAIRQGFLNTLPVRRQLHTEKTEHYASLGEFHNR
jgi:hypothetical protein